MNLVRIQSKLKSRGEHILSAQVSAFTNGNGNDRKAFDPEIAAHKARIKELEDQLSQQYRSLKAKESHQKYKEYKQEADQKAGKVRNILSDVLDVATLGFIGMFVADKVTDALRKR